jgi:PAS domain S-box-containing protein
LARLVAQMPAVIWSTNRDLIFTSVEGRVVETLGQNPDLILGRSLQTYLGTDDPDNEAIRNHTRALKGETVAYMFRQLDHDFTCQVGPLRADDGSIEGCVGLAIDISDVRTAEDARRLSEAHYRALVEEAPIGIFRSSAGGRFLTVNHALVEMLGYNTADELLGLDLSADVYVDPGMRNRLTSEYSKTDRVRGVDVDWRRRDGTRITVRLSGQPVRSAEGEVEAWEMVAEDVTERRRLEAQLRTAQKMEALGLVTGGVAHDFNNLLTSILANAELISSALPTSLSQIRSDILEIRDAAGRGGDLVKKLLGFSRRERLSMQPTEVGTLLVEMADVLQRLVPDRIKVDVQVDEDLPPALADAGALQQILLNLATNARDAIAESGELRLRASRSRIDPGHLAEFGWGAAATDYVVVRVEDTGLGMDEATRARVFEPFFTTKPPGAGSGLGLAMVYGLMKQQNGFVGITSQPDRGTVVTLYLPITGKKASAPVRHEPVRAEGEVILVVEDEEPIRRVARRVLERHGFRVLTAADGLEALSVFRENEQDVALILSDVVMPRMGGRALHETLRGAGKQVPMVFMSGYASRGEGNEGTPMDASMVVLPKPWSVEQLVARVKEAIGQRA